MTTSKILLAFDPEQKNILPALQEINSENGYISKSDAQKAADYFSVPLSKIYETASFYDLLRTEKSPQILIQVCSSANCALSESFGIISEIENTLHIKSGDKNNPKIRLEEVNCLGRCGEGPIVVVNGKIYLQVTASSIHGILKEYL